MSDVAIELRHVSKHFGPKVAVNDVSFDVLKGQCYGLIGPNGAGKTTTFSMMCGFLHPTAGLLRILGEEPSRPGALKGKVGVLPQDALLPATWPVGAFLTYLELQERYQDRDELKTSMQALTSEDDAIINYMLARRAKPPTDGE